MKPCYHLIPLLQIQINLDYKPVENKAEAQHHYVSGYAKRHISSCQVHEAEKSWLLILFDASSFASHLILKFISLNWCKSEKCYLTDEVHISRFSLVCLK